MSCNVIVNGRFMEDRMQGIVRYARELLTSLDPILSDSDNVTLLVPPTAYDIPDYRNIRVVKAGRRGGLVWEQTVLRRYVRQNRDCFCLNLCNVTPILIQPGITAVLDIMYRVNPDHYTTLRNRLSRLWHCLQYSYIARHEKRIITISNFSCREIAKYYPEAAGKTEIVPCAWQHVKRYKESCDWQERYPYLKYKQFFFSLATLAKNKNGKWIIEAAANNPEAVFVVAGKHYETEYSDIPDNVHLLGYISDEDACALIRHCKAFIFPSVYEGFGLPPIEALALGAEVISSGTTSLPEVLSDSVHYIDPFDPDVDIEKLMEEPLGDRSHALNQFSWERSAELLLNILKNE